MTNTLVAMDSLDSHRRAYVRLYTSRMMFLLTSLIASVVACGANKPAPKFEDYMASERLAGTPKAPVLDRVREAYRPLIINAIRSGEGLIGNPSALPAPRPNFAGVFYAISWGCGSDGCASLAILDGRTGAVYGPPPNAADVAGDFVVSQRTNECTGILLRRDSRLIAVDYTVWTSGQPMCRRSFYEWRDNKYSFVSERIVKPGAK